MAADPNRDLTDLEGIGKDLAQKISELLTTGSVEMLEQLRAEIPGGVLAWCEFLAWGRRRRPPCTRNWASARSMNCGRLAKQIG